jgi:hypothetical protein
LYEKPHDNIAHNGTVKTERMGKNNGYSKEQWLTIQRNPWPESKNRKEIKTTTTKPKQKWAVFTYHSPLVRKETNLFKQTQLEIKLSCN